MHEYVYDVVVKKFTFAISSPDEFLVLSTYATYAKTEYVRICAYSSENRSI